MPRSLHASVSLSAKAEGVSLNQLIVYRLSYTASLAMTSLASTGRVPDRGSIVIGTTLSTAQGLTFMANFTHAYSHAVTYSDPFKIGIAGYSTEAVAAKNLILIDVGSTTSGRRKTTHQTGEHQWLKPHR